MEHDLEKVCARKIKTLQNQRQVCIDFVLAAKTKCSIVESIVEHGHDLHIVHTAKEYIPGMKELSNAEKLSMGVLENITNLGKYDTFLTELYDAKENEGNNTQESILAEIRSVVSEIRQLSKSPSTPPEPVVPAVEKTVQLVKKIGRKGSEEGEFSFPSGITFLPSGELVVADMHNHRIQVFGTEGEFKRSFGGNGFKPCGIIANKDGNLAVTDCSTGKSGIKVFTPHGELKQSLGEGQFEYPFSIAIDSRDRYIVCDSATNRIIILKENGEFYGRFATKTKFAFYLTVNYKNEILLSDWFNHCVKVFDTSGTLLRRIGSKGFQDGQLMIPLGLCPDKNGNVFILDCKCGRVSMFRSDGQFVKHLIGAQEGIEYSRAIAISNMGQLAVSSGDNRGHIPNEIRLYKIM
jgi:tripartite motif-containing protein 2/3